MKNILTDHITIKLGYSIIGFNSLFFYLPATILPEEKEKMRNVTTSSTS